MCFCVSSTGSKSLKINNPSKHSPHDVYENVHWTFGLELLVTRRQRKGIFAKKCMHSPITYPTVLLLSSVIHAWRSYLTCTPSSQRDRIREHLTKSCMVLSLSTLSSWCSHETPCLSEKREWDMTTAKLLRCYVDTQVKATMYKVNTSYEIIMVIILNFKNE